jgi:hypothetical protein
MFSQKRSHDQQKKQREDISTVSAFVVSASDKDLFYMAEGVRSTKASGFLDSPESADKLLVMMLVIRPCEHLLFTFFQQQDDRIWKGVGGQALPLVDLASVCFSPAATAVDAYVKLLDRTDNLARDLLQGQQGSNYNMTVAKPCYGQLTVYLIIL